MAGNQSINIGGVRFNKADVTKAEKVKQDGQELNSIFLKDGTRMVYPDQDAKNNASVTQKEKTALSYEYGSGYNYEKRDVSIGELGVYSKKTDEVETQVRNMNGGTIFGTDKKDDITIFGSKNLTVDVSQEDNKVDIVQIRPEDKFFGKKSENITVKQNKEDVSTSGFVDTSRDAGTRKFLSL